jgi:hypothetical protein
MQFRYQISFKSFPVERGPNMHNHVYIGSMWRKCDESNVCMRRNRLYQTCASIPLAMAVWQSLSLRIRFCVAWRLLMGWLMRRLALYSLNILIRTGSSPCWTSVLIAVLVHTINVCHIFIADLHDTYWNPLNTTCDLSWHRGVPWETHRLWDHSSSAGQHPQIIYHMPPCTHIKTHRPKRFYPLYGLLGRLCRCHADFTHNAGYINDYTLMQRGTIHVFRDITSLCGYEDISTNICSYFWIQIWILGAPRTKKLHSASFRCVDQISIRHPINQCI